MIESSFEAGLGRIVLAAPERANALGPDEIAAITDALSRLAREPGLEIVVIEARGDVFSAGGSLEALQAATPRSIEAAASGALGALYDAFFDCPAPTLCALNGAASGGGLGLALMADVIVAKASARLVAPFARLGLVPDSGLTKTLTAALGPARAKLLFLSAGALDAHAAYTAGLVSEVAEADAFDAAVNDRIRTLRALAPGLARDVRRLVAETPMLGFKHALRLEGALQGERLGLADTKARIARAIETMSKPRS